MSERNLAGLTALELRRSVDELCGLVAQPGDENAALKDEVARAEGAAHDQADRQRRRRPVPAWRARSWHKADLEAGQREPDRRRQSQLRTR